MAFTPNTSPHVLELVAEIDELTADNLATVDADRERRIRELRVQVPRELRPSAAAGPWPRPAPDPFPCERGLPEIDGAMLTPDIVAGALAHHGSLIVRNFLPPFRVKQLVAAVDASLDGAAANREPDASAATAGSPWFEPLDDGMISIFGAGDEWVRVVDSPRAMFEVIEAFQPMVDEVVQPYLGERPTMGSTKWTLRRITPNCYGGWHQDGKFLGEQIRVLNTWVALSRCGGDTGSVGMEILPQNVAYIAPTGTEGAFIGFEVSRRVVERLAGERPPVDPVFEPGDALLFDQYTLHRTGSKPGLTKNRYAIESWFFSPSTYPLDTAPTPIFF